MSEAELITVEVPEGNPPQTLPVEPSARIPTSDIVISAIGEEDFEALADGMYASFPEGFWGKMEPPALRPSLDIRIARLAKRLRPSLSLPHMKFIKASLATTGQMIGVAGWMAPGAEVYNVWRRSAVEHFKFAEHEGWTEAEVADMWAGTDIEAWKESFDAHDDIRKEVMGDEPHWYLAPLFVYPEYQGRGVGKLLMDWAIEQADRMEPPTPLYLEAAPYARPVYLHAGFVPCGKVNLVRRGPPSRKKKD